MSRTLLLFVFVAICTIDARMRRQTSDEDDEEEQRDMAVTGWDPTIRDRFESCNSIATFAPTPEQYCKAFIMCCSMQFDPNNGDKCQTNEQRCIPLEDGSYDAVCIQRNCTELVTTTTTTTTPEPIVIEEEVNSSGSIFIAVTSLVSLWLLH
ncbi:unnamed protein product [Haemonchus placei]|uniref:Uncharacterized protein n=1 Tax=Haemonchus placei TaxID=6290 RepID=A0A0N4WN32_HAEPC|nr:unnamed protein product [Haemonchus placei]